MMIHDSGLLFWGHPVALVVCVYRVLHCVSKISLV